MYYELEGRAEFSDEENHMAKILASFELNFHLLANESYHVDKLSNFKIA
jgi:hypothetical protein